MNQSTLKYSLGLRLTLIALLTLLLLIPSFMIRSLITERQDRRHDAIKEVSEKWGEMQTLTGPIISLPFTEHSKDKYGKTITLLKYAHFLPDEIFIKGKISPQIRYRGIYEIVLYNTQLQIEAKFSHPSIENLNIPSKAIHWEDAFIAIGISDMKGIKDLIKVKWNRQAYNADPSIETSDILGSGISIRPNLDPLKTDLKYEFSTTLNLNGSSNLKFTPIGKVTNVEIVSSWKSPSFTGRFLPENREILNDGFNAKWRVLHLNRNYPQYWIGSNYKISSSSFGVNLYLPVDQYQKTMRISKYAIMFISLTFLSFFLVELINQKNIHPIQYLLIGFALLVFYTLLLSLSEHIVFSYAYLIASVGIIILISVYSKSVLKNNLQMILIGGILCLLYGYLYVVLQLQDYALLLGSIGLFIILAIIMYVTRKIDWFTVMRPEESKDISEK